MGYVVLEAASGPEALNIIAANGEIALVFSDVVMPGGMSGYDIAHWLSEHKPELPIVLTSGFSASSGLHDLPVAAHSILHKPYGRAELSRVLHHAIASKSGAAVSDALDGS